MADGTTGPGGPGVDQGWTKGRGPLKDTRFQIVERALGGWTRGRGLPNKYLLTSAVGFISLIY